MVKVLIVRIEADDLEQCSSEEICSTIYDLICEVVPEWHGDQGASVEVRDVP